MMNIAQISTRQGIVDTNLNPLRLKDLGDAIYYALKQGESIANGEGSIGGWQYHHVRQSSRRPS